MAEESGRARQAACARATTRCRLVGVEVDHARGRAGEWAQKERKEARDEEERGPAAAAAAPDVLDLEWQQFQATVVNAPDIRETYEHATIVAEPVLAPEVPQGFPGALGGEPAAQEGEEEVLDEEALRRKKEMEERELIMDRLLEEEQAQEEADARVAQLKSKLEALKKKREAARAAKKGARAYLRRLGSLAVLRRRRLRSQLDYTLRPETKPGAPVHAPLWNIMRPSRTADTRDYAGTPFAPASRPRVRTTLSSLLSWPVGRLHPFSVPRSILPISPRLNFRTWPPPTTRRDDPPHAVIVTTTLTADALRGAQRRSDGAYVTVPGLLPPHARVRRPCLPSSEHIHGPLAKGAFALTASVPCVLTYAHG
ncbi:hypothetical protein NUW54_g12445 [Trametes sanguinea]|uniref:Uncharacterized protein n=1 Tax=Trametes sanguinea TaxID=158606 RepID=A0ACC1MXG3_9APHY|nr:hypothetical protein NUW54_g12445 [Trametes sanguinea]